MDERLLVRVYDVGFGDCIYVRIPDKDDAYHVLIDCGGSMPADPTLKEALDDVRAMLPKEQGSGASATPKKRLDLLVVTHPHADHVKGFDPAWFKGIRIRHLWLSAFMQEGHPQAKQAHALQALTERAANALQARGLRLGAGLSTLLTNSIANPGALRALRTTLPQASHIKPLYVCRDIARRFSTAERNKHGLRFEGGTTCLQDFRETGTRLRVLAPEWDIDGYYLGQAPCDYQALLGFYGQDLPEARGGAKGERAPQPANVSAGDFRLLRNRLFYSALAFLKEDQGLKNNTSVVLLLEWRGRRLLFAGDAEWNGKGVKKGQRNGCWDVMFKVDEAHGHLSRSLDFLKVGHHGSVNGTPFVDKAGAPQPVLDRLLPVGGQAQVVVSTLAGEHGEKKVVPYPDLMEELGRRAANARPYPNDHAQPDVPQPPRTDLEARPVDVLLRAAPG